MSDRMKSCISWTGCVASPRRAWWPGRRDVRLTSAYVRVGQDGATKRLRIQLVGGDDPTVDEDETAEGRWRAYVASYVMVHATEWVPAGATQAGPAFLKRYVWFIFRA